MTPPISSEFERPHELIPEALQIKDSTRTMNTVEAIASLSSSSDDFASIMAGGGGASPSPSSSAAADSNNNSADEVVDATLPRRFTDHTYHDFSNYIKEGGKLKKHKKSESNFPARLHAMLSDEQYSHIITWMVSF